MYVHGHVGSDTQEVDERLQSQLTVAEQEAVEEEYERLAAEQRPHAEQTAPAEIDLPSVPSAQPALATSEARVQASHESAPEKPLPA